MSVVPHRPAPPAARWIDLLGEAARLARMIANTNFVPKGMRGDEAAIAATILYGDEIGLPPMQALAKIAVIDGKPSLSAEGQRSLIQAAGHSLQGAGTTTRFTWTGRRGDTGDTMEFTWTLDDAKKAGIAGKQNWRTYPRAMLSARASAELARALFADVIGGLMATEELEEPAGPANVAGGADPPAPDAPPATTRKRVQTNPDAVIAPAPILQPPPPPPSEPPIPDDYPEPPPPRITDDQLKKLMVLFRERGYADRDDRLAWANQQLDRHIDSAGDLTDIEAHILISALESAPGPAEQPQFELGTDPAESPVSSERIDVIMFLRGEAHATDEWMRAKLAALGVENLPKRIDRNVLKRLTRSEAMVLSDALSSEVDARPPAE